MGCIYFEIVLNDFVSKLVETQNIFPLLSKVLWSCIKVSKVGDISRGWPEDSLFDSYYTKV